MIKTGFLRTALLTLTILLAQVTWALAGTTGSIEGKVTDQNGNGITGAKVTAASPAQSVNATTVASGFYAILNLSPDTYAVTASKDGYETATVYGVTVTADQATAANVQVHQAIRTLGHITTTATASVVSKTVTGDLYAVNAQAIDRYQGGQGGAETLYKQDAIVASLPGVVRQVGLGGGYGGQGVLSLRGGAFDQVGYELDGVPINRGFDFFNGTTGVTNGLASLQVYTGGAPADAGHAMSGYVNQTFQRGKYPGGADFTGVLGGPLFNHTLQADVYGATPDGRFTYYVSTLAANQYVNFGTRSNLANTSFVVPAGDPGCGAFNEGLTPGGTTGGTLLNCAATNVLNQPVSQGAYAAAPFTTQRDTATNLHWAFQHGGLSDDLQMLYVVGTSVSTPYGFYGTTFADPAQASVNYSGDGTVGVGPNPNALTWPTGHYYTGVVGRPYNPALLLPLTWPTSNGSINGQIPSTFSDSQNNQYAIEKLAYTRALTQSSFLRVFGYTMYTGWTLDQPINGIVGSSFYQLHDNATGVQVNYQNQINQQNLLKVIGDWSRDRTLRYNYFNYTAATNCVAHGAGGADTACDAPGLLVTRAQGPASNWSTVTPLDWDGVINDSWKPSDKLNFDLGLRWDYLAFQLMPMQISGPNGLAEQSALTQGVCLHGYNYPTTDPRDIGPNGDQNCHDILSALGGTAAPGAGAWKDVSGTLAYTLLSPRFGVTFTLDPRNVLRLSVGRYVQPPNSAFEQYQNAPFWGPATTVARLNSFYDALGFTAVHNALPEDSTNYDFSVEHEFAGGLSAKLTPFYRNTRNQVLNLPVNPLSPSFVTGYNFGNARIKGAEFLVSKNVNGENGIGGTLAATYTDSKIRFNQLNGSSFINVQNGTDGAGVCKPAAGGICNYNQAYGTNYPLLDPNAWYSPSYVQAPGSTGPSWDVRWVINLQLDVRQAGFDFVPTFNYQSGSPYGDPLNFPDAHCAAPGPAPAGVGCTPLPAGVARYGGNGPDPYTNAFDAPGSLRGPSWWTVNLAVSHDIGHNLKASVLGTNLIAGVHNQGYAWEQNPNQQNVSYGDNLFYNTAPLGAFAGIAPSPAQAYYGNNYYPYASAGILPYRDWVFSVSAKI